jgi:hypothetical protein
MILERFRHLAACHGADIARWPAREQQAGWHLAETCPEAQACLEEARRLDRLLDLGGMGWKEAHVGDVQAERMLGVILQRIDRPISRNSRPEDDVASSAFASMILEQKLEKHGRRPLTFSLLPVAGFLAAMAVAGFLVGNLGLIRGLATAENQTAAFSSDVVGLTTLASSPSYLRAWNL